MYNLKSMISLSVLILISQFGFAQKAFTDSIQQAIPEKKWSFAVSLGTTLIGPGSALNREMKEIGFGDYPPDFNFFDFFKIKNNQEYPRIKKAITWDMETRLNLSRNSALAFSLGKSHHYTVDGYSREGFQNFNGSGRANYLTIVHDVWYVSADYVFRYAPGYGGIAVGPVMAMHRVSEGESSASGVRTSTLKPGFHIGGDLPLFQKKSWFMAFGLNYTWLPPTEIGPNTEKLRIASGGGFPGVHGSGNQSNTIPLATFQMSVTTGWRF